MQVVGSLATIDARDHGAPASGSSDKGEIGNRPCVGSWKRHSITAPNRKIDDRQRVWTPAVGSNASAGVLSICGATESLERFAEGRASRAVRALEAASPRVARRIDATGITDVPATEIVVGDRLMVRPGDLV